jgi:nicotinamidase-related amidase
MDVWALLGEEPPPLVKVFDPLPDMRVETGRTALLIVDMDRGSATPGEGLIATAESNGVDMTYYQERLETIVPNIASLQRAFRENRLEVAFTKGRASKAGHKLGGVQVRPLARASNAAASASVARGRDILASLAPLPGELVVEKNTPGPFGVTNIDHALRMLGVDILVVTGVVTDQCVESTVRGAFDHGYQVILVEDACATVSPELHRGSLRATGDWFCRVRSTEEVLAQCQTLQEEPA